MSAPPVPPRRLWWLLLGFIVWCSALVALYALHAIGCAFAWSPGSLRLWLALLLLAHLAAVGGMWRHLARAPAAPAGGTESFLHIAALWTTIAAVFATVLVLGPPLLLTTCV